MIKSVILFCLLVGLEVVYSEDGPLISVFVTDEETITYHGMTIPPQSFFASPSEGEGHKFVRDRTSPQPPMITFNNGDIKHIIDEMHLTPRQQQKVDDNDFDVQVTFFSFDPRDEDLGTAMKNNRHIETRLPVFSQQIPTLRAPSKKVIPQAPAQRIALAQSPLQELKAHPSKPIEPIKLKPLPNYESVRSYKPDTAGNSKGRVWSVSLPLDMDEKELNTEGMFSDSLEDLLASFLEGPFESKSRTIEEKKPDNRVSGFENDGDIFSVLKSLLAETPGRDSSPAVRKTKAAEASPVTPRSTRAVSTSTDALLKFPTQNAVQAPDNNVLYLQGTPDEFIKFIKAMDESEGVSFADLFSSKMP